MNWFRILVAFFFVLPGFARAHGQSNLNILKLVLTPHTNLNYSTEGVSIDIGIISTTTNAFLLWVPKQTRGILLEAINPNAYRKFGGNAMDIARLAGKSEKQIKSVCTPYLLHPGQLVTLDNWSFCNNLGLNKNTNYEFRVRVLGLKYDPVRKQFDCVTASNSLTQISCN